MINRNFREKKFEKLRLIEILRYQTLVTKEHQNFSQIEMLLSVPGHEYLSKILGRRGAFWNQWKNRTFWRTFLAQFQEYFTNFFSSSFYNFYFSHLIYNFLQDRKAAKNNICFLKFSIFFKFEKTTFFLGKRYSKTKICTLPWILCPSWTMTHGGNFKIFLRIFWRKLIVYFSYFARSWLFQKSKKWPKWP